MNLRKFKNILPLAAVALSMGVSSCVKDLDVKPIDPRENMTVDAQKLLNKCYAEFVFEGFGPGSSELDLGDAGLSVLYRLLWNANELTTDEAICGWTDKGIINYDFNNYTENSDVLYGLWWRLSFGVSLCNQYIQVCSDTDKTMTAEAHFLRALYYYYLLDSFGNPAFTDKVSTDNPTQIQSADLFKFIVDDLEATMGDLLEPSVRKKGEANYARADQSAAWMLLARLYLNAEKYTGTPAWDKAKYYANEVLTKSGRSIWMGDNATTHTSANGEYSAYQMLFMADNDVTGAYNENVFGFALEGSTSASWGASTFLVASTRDSRMAQIYPQTTTEAWGGNRTRKDLIEKFISLVDFDALPNWSTETIVTACGDDRALFFGDNAKGDPAKGIITGPKDRKYTNGDISEFTEGIATTKFNSVRSDNAQPSNTTHVDNDIMLMRLAEANLIYAEAEAREAGSNTTLTRGTELINELRTRANNTVKKNAYTLNEILDERARELYFEGLRRTDLIRYGYYGGNNSYMWQWKGGTQEGSKFEAFRNIFPIPAKELGTNSNLKQNDGYSTK